MPASALQGKNPQIFLRSGEQCFVSIFAKYSFPQSANYKENKGGGAGDQDSAASTKVGDEVRLGDGHDPPVQGETFLRPTCFALLFFFLQIEYQPEEYTVPVRKCEQGQAKKCFKYEVPKWKVVRNAVVKLIQRITMMDISLSRPSSR